MGAFFKQTKVYEFSLEVKAVSEKFAIADSKRKIGGLP
jgi:hypothetical protein